MSVTVREWGDVCLTIWQGPEGQDEAFRTDVDRALDEVGPEADANAFENQADWNLPFDTYVGLGNLPESERFPLPEDIKNLGSVDSHLSKWGDHAASVEVHFWASGAATPILVVAGSLVVGRYSSLDELRAHIDPGDSFGASENPREPDDND